MEQYYVSPHVSWCRTDEGLVLIDMKKGKYLGISKQDLCSLTALVPTWQENPSMDAANPCDAHSNGNCGALVESLLVAGILQRSAKGSAQQSVVPDTPSDSIQYSEVVAVKSARPIHYIGLMFSCITAALKLKLFTVHRIVTSNRKRKQRLLASGHRDDEVAIRSLATVFLYLRPYFITSKDRCLFDSLVLFEFMLLNGLCPSWIIGTKTQPFAAHSWVQCGPLVLNDTPGKVLAYTPIVAV